MDDSFHLARHYTLNFSFADCFSILWRFYEATVEGRSLRSSAGVGQEEEEEESGEEEEEGEQELIAQLCICISNHICICISYCTCICISDWTCIYRWEGHLPLLEEDNHDRPLVPGQRAQRDHKLWWQVWQKQQLSLFNCEQWCFYYIANHTSFSALLKKIISLIS